MRITVINDDGELFEMMDFHVPGGRAEQVKAASKIADFVTDNWVPDDEDMDDEEYSAEDGDDELVLDCGACTTGIGAHTDDAGCWRSETKT